MTSIILALALGDELEEARKLMERSAELLHELRAKASLPVQEDILRRLHKMIEETRAAEAASSSETRRSEPGRRAERPYPDRRTERPSKFAGRGGPGGWGDLPERLREAILHAARDIDSYPPALRGPMEEYFRRLARGE